MTVKSLSCERALDSVEPMTLGTFSVAGPVETVTVTEELALAQAKRADQ